MTANGFGRGGGYRGRDMDPRGNYQNQNGYNHSNSYPDVGGLSLNDSRSDNGGGPPKPPAGLYETADDSGGPAKPLTPPRDTNHRSTSINRAAFSRPPAGTQPPAPVPYNQGGFDRFRDDEPIRPRKQDVPPPPGYQSPYDDPRVDRKQSTSSNNEYAFNNNSQDVWAGPPPANNLHHGDNSAPAELDRRYGSQENSYVRSDYNGRGGFNGSRGGHDQRNGYDNQYRGVGASREDLSGARGGYGASRGGNGSYNDPRGGHGGSRGGYDQRNGYDGHHGSYNAPQRGYGNTQPPMPNRRGPSNDYNNYRNQNGHPVNYHDSYDRRSPSSASPRNDNSYNGYHNQGRRDSYGSTGSNNSANRSYTSAPRTGGNDVPLGNNRFANTNQNTRPIPEPSRDSGYYGAPINQNRAPRDYVPGNRDVNEIFEDDRNHSVNDGTALMEQDAEIEVNGPPGFARMKCEHWKEMQLHPSVLDNIEKSGYTYPRKIQQHTIPYVLENFDIMCQGETGSGKTAAFLVPTIHKFLQDKASGAWKYSNRPYCLILSPTRELANQLYDQTTKFANGTGVRVERSYGEINVRENIRQVSRCDILIGCIGRLHDLMTRGNILADGIKMLIIDEADRFFIENDTRKFFSLFEFLPKRSERQTLLFSATLGSPQVIELATQHMRDNYIDITAKTQSNSRITYLVYAAETEIKKLSMLETFLKRTLLKNKNAKFLVFVNQKSKTDQLATDLADDNVGIIATTIHGDRSQDLREEALQDFRSGKVQVLITTDVCARGVDIYEMDYVINVDLPREKSTFVQRCGRTGRTRPGVAVSFYFERSDNVMGHSIAEVIENSQQVAPSFLREGVKHDDYGIPDNTERYDDRRSNYSPPHNGAGGYAPQPGRGRSSAAVIPDQSVNDDW